jgi:hypothetical protein
MDEAKMTEQVLKRGIVQGFSAASYTADVLIIEATSYVLSHVPLATNVDGTSVLTGASCVVLFLDAHNPNDAVIIALYGLAPSPTPGRVVFASPILQVSAQSIPSNTTSTFTLSGLPAGALGVIFKAFFTSPTAGASLQIAPHGGTSANYASIGNLYAANAMLYGNGMVPVDSNGALDIKANGGNCTTTLFTYGYVF